MEQISFHTIVFLERYFKFLLIMKKVSVVGIVGLPACYGGFETLVENLESFKSDTVHYTVFCSSKSYDSRPRQYKSADLKYIPLSANGMPSILYDIVSIFKSCLSRSDVILVLGVSGCVVLPLVKLFSNSKIVTNIDGLEWKRNKWNKLAKRFLKFSEYFAVKYSDVVITDNQAISDYVETEYGKKSYTIAYGGDHALLALNKPSNGVSFGTEIEYSLALCRIEPENNVHLILEAYANSEKKLKFIGNWDSSEYGRYLKSKYSMFRNIDIIDPIYDLEELYWLRKNCLLYVHGHSAGGTNPSLVEIMHFGKPVLAFDCIFNRYTTNDQAFYFDTSEKLLQLINELIYTDSVEVGNLMKKTAEENYVWNKIASSYEALY